MLPIYITLVYEGSSVSTRELTRVAAALDKQVTRDIGPIWSVEATVNPAFSLDDVPVGSWPIILVEDAGDPRVLGYHRDGFGQPYAKVALTDSWSLTASHECLEMLVDPFGDRMVPGPSLKEGEGRVSYLVEVCDPVQSSECSYTVNDVMVSDFVTPRFYDPLAASGVRYSFTGNTPGPRGVLEDGYITWRNQTNEHMMQFHVRRGGGQGYTDLGRLEGFAGSVREFVDSKTEHPELERGLSRANKRLQSAIESETYNRRAREQNAEALRDHMSSERNKALIDQFWEVFDSARELTEAEEVFDSIFDPDFVLRETGSEERGPASIKALVRDIRTAVPDFQLTVEEQIAAEGDKVVTRWTGRGHHTGKLEGVKPSGRMVTLYVTSIFRVSRGRIAESWMNIVSVRPDLSDIFGRKSILARLFR
jgi:predicted ester cyclase